MPGALTRREAEVMALLGEHLSHAEIADRLVLSVRTVESHVASARRKLGIEGRRDLVRYAAEHRARAARAARLPEPLTPFVGRAQEAAVLAGAPDAEARLVEAERACASSEVLSLVVRRSRALAGDDHAVLAGIAERLDAAGAPCQAERTRALAGGRRTTT